MYDFGHELRGQIPHQNHWKSPNFSWQRSVLMNPSNQVINDTEVQQPDAAARSLCTVSSCCFLFSHQQIRVEALVSLLRMNRKLRKGASHSLGKGKPSHPFKRSPRWAWRLGRYRTCRISRYQARVKILLTPSRLIVHHFIHAIKITLTWRNNLCATNWSVQGCNSNYCKVIIIDLATSQNFHD